MERSILNRNGWTREAVSTSLPADAPGSRSIDADPIQMVDEAVLTVLADFRLAAPRPAGGRAADLVFADRLFSLRLAEALPAGVRSIKIAPGTVMTPLARDFLKRRGVAVRLAGRSEIAPTARGEWGFALGANNGQLQALQRAFLEDAQTWSELDSSVDAMTAWIRGGDGRGAFWVTVDPALVVWRACQVPGVRAAAAAEPADARSASRSLGANLLVVEPSGKSISWIRQIAMAFRDAGAPRLADESQEAPL